MTEPAGFTIEDGAEGRDLVVTGDWTAATERELLRPDVTGLTLNYARGFRERNLDFLRDWPIRQLTILARTLDDLSPVYRLAGTLERLSVQSAQRAEIDLRRLPWLTAVSAEWQQIANTVEYAVALNHLYASSYGGSDLTPLQRNEALVRLQMKQHPRLISLDGLARLTALRDLGIYGARTLSDISSLDPNAGAPKLHSVHLDSCSAFTSLTPLVDQTDLEALGIANCGPIDSLGPVAGASGLARLWAWESTRIADGDLTPLLGLTNLSDFRMMNRRHYRPSVAEVKRHLAIPE